MTTPEPHSEPYSELSSESYKNTKKSFFFFSEETSSDTDELIRLLKEDTDVPNLVHGNALELLPEWFEEEKFKRFVF